ncbi:TlpA family protein disulfide reductase [Mucilaginibacter myungsuensis]|uniref:Redoxin family protein n=1 Tax=Mucilaginibacter myungsuensis TaxID=649104 RepID=A0A929KTA2_9SPHI|nr:TlpA disulfide reductase family protein [Mucilaginibacter myungsuensis]MBE9661151.1 redoxin family protein [Mucilaginibacter myungsuensis]MDN3597296.1 redoxin family protein [Mucilaginibacter myungsuensis]
MKKITITVLLAIATLSSMAQFKISGHIDHISRPDSIILNLPYVYGYYRENNQTIPVDAKGNFSFTVPLREQKFATIDWQNKEISILMTPGKSLLLTLDTGRQFKKFAGTAGIENDLLHQAKLHDIAFFMQGDRTNNKYGLLNAAEMEAQVVKPWLKMRDDMITKINASALPTQTKTLIASEVKYFHYAILSDFGRVMIPVDMKKVDDFILSVFDGTTPQADVFPAGPMYYYFHKAYLNYTETKAVAKYGQKDPRAFLEIYKMPLDSAKVLVNAKGKPYINWILVKNNADPKVAEQYLAQAIFTQIHDKNINFAETLMSELEKTFPQSVHKQFLQNKITGLNALYLANKNNESIQVFKGYEKVKSIYNIVSTLKGKVVYLDIWGTWCGPCKEEIAYLPKLKKHFEGKDVVYLYLDMDDDEKDEAWKQFIRVNGMTGIHIRKNGKDVQAFWAELQADENKRGYYPTYFIFNKDGKLVQPNAERPSAEDALYKQLEKYL